MLQLPLLSLLAPPLLPSFQCSVKDGDSELARNGPIWPNIEFCPSQALPLTCTLQGHRRRAGGLCQVRDLCKHACERVCSECSIRALDPVGQKLQNTRRMHAVCFAYY